MTKPIRLGEMLINKGLAKGAQIEEAHRIQIGGNRRLGTILVKMGVISEDQLVEVLADQLELPVVNPETEFSPATKRVLPRYLCQKYMVVPLTFGEHNTLAVAMIDPSDAEAIDDIERYTGKVVKPMLAHGQEIALAIKRLVPLSRQDIFNPLLANRLAQVTSAATLILLIFLGLFSSGYIHQQKYGTISTTGNSTSYQNHELIVGVEPGKFSLFGHGAYAQGFYAASFDNLDGLKHFIEKSRKNFSNDQENWLNWVINTKLNQKP